MNIPNDDYGKYNFQWRNIIIGNEGISSYEEYLKSDIWKRKREEVLKAFSLCKICHKKATTIHHRYYTRDNLFGDSLKHLISLCFSCHKLIEFDNEGNKILNGTTIKLRLKWAARIYGNEKEMKLRLQQKHGDSYQIALALSRKLNNYALIK